MTRIRTLAAGALAAISLGLSMVVAAQMPYGPGPANGPSYGPRPGQAPGTMRPGGQPDPAFVRQNLEALHGRLAVRADQEPVWQAFAFAVQHQTEQMQSMRERMPRQGSTAPERFDYMAKTMQQTAAGVAGVARALTALYAVLDPQQRAIVDREFTPSAPQGPQ
jgi:hypothetical protein